MSDLRERLGSTIFERVAGKDGPKHRSRIHDTPGPRWFPEGSAITRVHGDASMFIGGIRAVFLQTLQPAAMTAVAEHSGYRGDMWGRLARTSRFLAVTTFGMEDDAQQAVDVVRSIHDRVVGTMPDGTTYAASDPHLLAWIHAAEIESFLMAHQVHGLEPLDQAGRDEYVAQTGEVARRLGAIDPPQTEAELRAVMAAFRPELEATDHAREAIEHLIKHPELPAVAKPAYAVLVAGAVALMPRWTRKPLGLPHHPVLERTVVRGAGHLATGTIRWAMRPPPSQTDSQAGSQTESQPSTA